jgi:hypothetical protein
VIVEPALGKELNVIARPGSDTMSPSVKLALPSSVVEVMRTAANDPNVDPTGARTVKIRSDAML